MVAVTWQGPMGCSERPPPAQRQWHPEEGLSLAPTMGGDGTRAWHGAAVPGGLCGRGCARSMPGPALMSVGARQC